MQPSVDPSVLSSKCWSCACTPFSSAFTTKILKRSSPKADLVQGLGAWNKVGIWEQKALCTPSIKAAQVFRFRTTGNGRVERLYLLFTAAIISASILFASSAAVALLARLTRVLLSSFLSTTARALCVRASRSICARSCFSSHLAEDWVCVTGLRLTRGLADRLAASLTRAACRARLQKKKSVSKKPSTNTIHW